MSIEDSASGSFLITIFGAPDAIDRLLQRLVSAPEFGPLVLLAVEILVFTLRSPAFLSASNISNLLAFTPELGMITLGMTLLMTAGEFDLSVGSVFGFAPIMMWTFYNTHAGPLEVGFLFAMGDRRFDRFHQRMDGDSPQNSVVPGHARNAVCRTRNRALHYRWVSSAYLDRQLHADEPHRRTIFLRCRSASTRRFSGSSCSRLSSVMC